MQARAVDPPLAKPKAAAIASRPFCDAIYLELTNSGTGGVEPLMPEVPEKGGFGETASTLADCRVCGA